MTTIENMRRNVLLMNSQVYFTNNGIDLGEFLSLIFLLFFFLMRSIIYHIIVERVIIN